MAFNPNAGRAEYTATASQTDFIFNFKIFANTDIEVYQTPVGNVADDTADILTLTTDYTVTIDGDNGGTVTLVTGASAGDSITIVRSLDITRTTEYQTSGDFQATTVNADQDYQTYLLGDRKSEVDRAIKLPKSAQGFSAELPAPTAGKIPAVKDDGTGFEFLEKGAMLYQDAFIVENMTALLSVDSATYGTTHVRGYYVSNDGGGGLFNWDATADKSTANAGTIIDPSVSLDNQGTGVGLGCWVRQYDGKVNVLWFGVDKTGGTDDTTLIDLAAASGEIEIPAGSYVSTRATALNYFGDGSVYTTIALTELNGKFNRQGNIAGNGDAKHFMIGCIPRCTAGVFSALDDSGHTPLNVFSISQPDDYNIRVNYDRTATKINSYTVQQDAELAKYGLDIGGNVGTSYADQIGYSNFNAFINGTSVNASALYVQDTTAAIASNKLTVTHGEAYLGDVPVVTLKYTNPSEAMMLAANYTQTTVEVTALSDLSGYIYYDGAAWQVTFTNNDSTEANITFSAATFGTIKVNHALCPDENVQLTGHNGNYIPMITSSATSNFEIGFYDFTGALVTTPNTNMKCWFRRKALVKSTYPTGMEVLIRRGNVPIKSIRYSNVAGNNLWVTGTMEY